MKKSLSILLALIIFPSLFYSQWVQTSGPNTQYIYSLLWYNNSLYAATTDGVFVTTNNGIQWIPKNNGINITNNSTYCFLASGNEIFCGADSGVYVSTDKGDSWIRKNNGLPAGNSHVIRSFLQYSSSDIYAATRNGVFLTTNSGEQWIARNSGMVGQPVYSFTVKDNKIFAGSDSKVFRSSDGGMNWVALETGLPAFHFSANALVTMGSNIIAGMCCGAGLFISSNNGDRWDPVNAMTANVLISNGDRVLAGANEGILVTSDNGLTWTAYNQGLQYTTTTALAYNSSKIFAGVEMYVWHRPVDELIAVQKISAQVSKELILEQNFPNPFNPSTKIQFSVPKSNGNLKNPNINLHVFNSLGQQVSVLVNQYLMPGTYEIEWIASDYPSGIYYYSLIVNGNVIDTKKMILIK